MPKTLIIQTNDDGTVLIAVPTVELGPEVMEGAESVASVDEAIQLATELLGPDEGGEPAEGGMGDNDNGDGMGGGDSGAYPQDAAPMGQSRGKAPQAGQDGEDQAIALVEGFKRAKAGH